MYTAKFDTFLFDQMIKFWKNRTCSISSNQFDEKEPIKIKIPTCIEKNYENITANEWTWNMNLFVHVNKISRFEIV